MNRIWHWVWVCLVAGAVFAPAAGAQQVVAESRFESAAGEPVSRELAFSASGYKDFVLAVQNGEADGSRRVSSALLALDGVKILAPSDFNQNVAAIERAISPKADGASLLAVTVRGNPGGFLHVRVLATPTFNLPPDPGPAGDATLEGVDSNGNGIRDDIERWIYLTYPNSEKLRRALIQEYYPMQNMIIHGSQGNRDAVYDDMYASMRSGECLEHVGPEDSYKISEELEARTVNTAQRFYGYNEASRMLGGGTFKGKHPLDWKSSCTFNPDSLND